MASITSLPPRLQVDLAIIGAGPAGCAAAIAAAHISAKLPRRFTIALIDKAIFPRSKVCGSCLSPLGVRLASDLGLAAHLSAHALPITSVCIDLGTHSAQLPVAPGGVAIERSLLDHALLNQARDLGVTVFQGTLAKLTDLSSHCASLTLTSPPDTSQPSPPTLDCRMLIAAGGLASSIDDPHSPKSDAIWKHARIGLGLLLPESLAATHLHFLPAGQMHMVTHPRGYAGLVRLLDGRVDLAAAVDPRLVRAAGSPSNALAAILRSSPRTHALANILPSLAVRGVPQLTRQSLPHRGCMLRAGDSLRYAEPFSGEGMSWALLAGTLAGQHAARCLLGESSISNWSSIIHRALTHRQRRCMWLARLLRVQPLVHAAVWGMGHAPALGKTLISTLAAPWGHSTLRLESPSVSL